MRKLEILSRRETRDVKKAYSEQIEKLEKDGAKNIKVTFTESGNATRMYFEYSIVENKSSKEEDNDKSFGSAVKKAVSTGNSSKRKHRKDGKKSS